MTLESETIKLSMEEAVQYFVNDRSDYYRQWMFDKPLLIKNETVEVASRLQKLMRKAIIHFVENYDKYETLMPINQKARAVVDCFSNKEYKIGTYRTDFVYDEDKRMRLIEITCRFALNGLFLPSIMESVADEHRQNHITDLEPRDIYSGVFDYMKSRFGNSTDIYVLKGGDTRNASKIYTDLLTRGGYTITDISYEELHQKIADINSEDVIISELALEEIESIPLETIQLLAEKNVINDLRTVFLIHDKRFFAVLNSLEFLRDVFSEEEIEFFSQYSIPTYTYDASYMHKWQHASQNKNDWIIKHSTLGKSQKIYAGVVMSQEEWGAIFRSEDLDKMILQQWIPQEKVNGTINGEQFRDFVTGTLLYFDDKFFGFGDFRTSSHPVINIVDHRKYCSLLLNEHDAILENYNTF